MTSLIDQVDDPVLDQVDERDTPSIGCA